MKKVIFICLFLISSAQADFWSKMFHKVDSNNPREMAEYGFQVGYQDAMNGQTNYAPSRDPFVQGYYEGRRTAIQDMMIQQRIEAQQYPSNIIVIYK